MKKYIMYLFVGILFLIAISKIIYLMFYRYDYYKEILDKQNNNIIYGSTAPRGRILDRNGKIIVDNVGIKTILYNKVSGISEQEEINIAKKLSSILEIDEGNIDELKYYYYINNREYINSLVDDKTYRLYEERKIDSKELQNIKLNLITDDMINELNNIDKKASKIYSIMNKGYNYEDKIIKKNCTDKEYSIITEMKLSGVRSELTFERINNYGDLLSNVIGNVGLIQSEDYSYYKSLGYSNDDIVGTSYLEKYYEKYLKGEKAKYKINNDNTITLISNAKIGNDLVLNIDIDIQNKIENILMEEIKKAKYYNNSKYYNGSYIVVSNPNDGGIIAFVGKSYNNGEFLNNEIGIINKSYTVGSAVKAATISVGYKNDLIDIGSKFNDSCVKLKNKIEKCSWKKLGTINDLQALAYSSNYYQFMIAIKLTGENYKYNMKLNNLDYAFKTYRDTLASYGLGVKTGIDLENENIGIIGNTISDDLLLNLSIGQYDTYTPIEMSQYINTVANGGKRIELRLMKEIISPEGKIIIKNNANVLNNVNLEAKYINRIKEGLKSVSNYGTGSSYIDKKYKASSKTGTSESIMDSDLDGISDTYTTTKTFISYMPNDNPLYSLVIVSPNISYQTDKNAYSYPINMYLARHISKILFDN